MFAEEVSERVICGVAVILVFAKRCLCVTRVSRKSVLQECQARVSEKKCQAKSVKQEVSSRGVL